MKQIQEINEVIRAGLRLSEEEEQKRILLRSAIDEGISSGIVDNFDPEDHLLLLKSKKQQNLKGI